MRACQCVREAQGPTLLPTDITSALPSLPLSLHPSRCPTGSEPRSETSLRVAHTGTGCRRRNHPAAPSSESSRFGSVDPRPTHMDALSHTHTLHTAHTLTLRSLSTRHLLVVLERMFGAGSPADEWAGERATGLIHSRSEDFYCAECSSVYVCVSVCVSACVCLRWGGCISLPLTLNFLAVSFLPPCISAPCAACQLELWCDVRNNKVTGDYKSSSLPNSFGCREERDTPSRHIHLKYVVFFCLFAQNFCCYIQG